MNKRFSANSTSMLQDTDIQDLDKLRRKVTFVGDKEIFFYHRTLKRLACFTWLCLLSLMFLISNRAKQSSIEKT